MKRRYLLGVLLILGLLAAAPLAFMPAKIPRETIEASVTHTPALLDRAWQLPVASAFQRQVAWQSNASLCGPASLANVFRSFGDQAATETTVLAGTGRCRTGFCIFGLTLDELAEVARAHPGRKVTVLRDLTPEAFHEHLRRANDPGRRYVVNFSRAAIFGQGVGHHSPIGGYLEDEDLVFVLDVNRDFQPWLIERSRLFSAMDTFDGDRKRGLLLIE
jgi:Phytochelatin synthase